MHLRDYQKNAVEAVMESWKDHPTSLVVLPTGCGKTVVFSEVINRIQPLRSMVVAHREELINQARDKIHSITGLDAQVEMADLRAEGWFGQQPQVVVSTIQTQTAGGDGGGRMTRFLPSDYGALVIDRMDFGLVLVSRHDGERCAVTTDGKRLHAIFPSGEGLEDMLPPEDGFYDVLLFDEERYEMCCDCEAECAGVYKRVARITAVWKPEPLEKGGFGWPFKQAADIVGRDFLKRGKWMVNANSGERWTCWNAKKIPACLDNQYLVDLMDGWSVKVPAERMDPVAFASADGMERAVIMPMRTDMTA